MLEVGRHENGEVTVALLEIAEQGIKDYYQIPQIISELNDSVETEGFQLIERAGEGEDYLISALNHFIERKKLTGEVEVYRTTKTDREDSIIELLVEETGIEIKTIPQPRYVNVSEELLGVIQDESTKRNLDLHILALHLGELEQETGEEVSVVTIGGEDYIKFGKETQLR